MSFTLCVSLPCICQSYQLSESSDHMLTIPCSKEDEEEKRKLCPLLPIVSFILSGILFKHRLHNIYPGNITCLNHITHSKRHHETLCWRQSYCFPLPATKRISKCCSSCETALYGYCSQCMHFVSDN